MAKKKVAKKKVAKKKLKEQDAAQQIETLREEHEVLSKRKVEVATNLKNTEKSLKKLKTEALKKYNSDDPVELEKMLTAMRSENAKKIADYRNELDKITSELDEIDKNYSE